MQDCQLKADNPDSVRLAKGAAVALGGRVIGRTVDIISQVTLARLLPPEAFGVYAIGWTVFRMLGVTAALGLDNGVIHYAPRYWRSDNGGMKSVLLQAIGLAVFSGMMTGVGMYSVAPWLGENVFHNAEVGRIIRWFSFAFFVYSGLKVVAVAITVSQKMQYAAYAVDITQPVVNWLLIVGLYAAGLGLSGAVAANICSFVVAFCLGCYYLKKLFPEVSIKQVRSVWMAGELLVYSLPTLLAGTLTLCILWADRLLAGYFLTPIEVGIYHAASQLAMVFASILDAFGATFSPMIAHRFHRGQTKQLDELFKVSTKWGLYCSLPLFLVMVIAPQEVMEVLFGEQYVHGAPVLTILAISQLINVGTGVASRLLILTGHQNRWLLLSAVTLAVSVFLSLLMIPRFGLVGVALSSAGAMGGLFLAGLLQVRHSLAIWPYDGRYWKGMAAALITAGVLIGLHTVKIGAPALHLLLMTAASIGVFGVMLLAFGLDDEEQEFLTVTLLRYRTRSTVEPAQF